MKGTPHPNEGGPLLNEGDAKKHATFEVLYILGDNRIKFTPVPSVFHSHRAWNDGIMFLRGHQEIGDTCLFPHFNAIRTECNAD